MGLSVVRARRVRVDSLSRSSSPLVRSPSLFSRVARPPATRLPPLCRPAGRPPPGERPFCLPRPRSTLRPVIKQPRGGQIESVQETRERRRRGDGQLAATMVSIVKGPSWCSRADIGARPKPDRMRGQNAGRRSGWLTTCTMDTSPVWRATPSAHPRARGESSALWTAAHRVVLPPFRRCLTMLH